MEGIFVELFELLFSELTMKPKLSYQEQQRLVSYNYTCTVMPRKSYVRKQGNYNVKLLVKEEYF